MKTSIKISFAVAVISLIVAGCARAGGQGDKEAMSQANLAGQMMLTKQTPKVNGSKEYTITAQASNLEVSKGRTLPVWTFNNSVPGPEIRVRLGDTVKIHLKNELEEPVSIHWHGYPLPNAMDGIPGVTQDAVVAGKTFTYEFKATVPGTYWYHSHQDSVNQLDKGLYGSFIVEDPKDSYDRDYTLILDEWKSSDRGDMKSSETNNHDMDGMEHTNMMDSMDHSNMNMGGMEGHDMSAYDLYTINGKTGDAIEKLMVKEGERVRLRLINAGYLTHTMHLHGHDFKVIATDGQPVNQPAVIMDQGIAIAPGERYDIEFTANHPGTWLFEEQGTDERVNNMRAVIQYEGASEQPVVSNATAKLPQFDLMRYGKQAATKLSLNQTFDQDVRLLLNTEMKNGEMVYTINGKVFPETDPITVNKGDKVRVTFVNQSMMDDHPMHLHGHFFQVLSKNGQPIEGAPVIKDTLNVKPGETYEVAFEADNAGDWMFHCHDLHHAAAGMVTDVMYNGYKSNYVPDPSIGNKPE